MDIITTAVTPITLDAGKIVHAVKADFTERRFPPTVKIVQYDESLPVIAASLYQGGSVYTIPSGAAVNIRVRKPDNTYVYNGAIGCDTNRQVVYFEVSEQMAAAYGDGRATVELVVNGEIAGTSLILLQIEENPVPEDAIESSDEYQTIYDLAETIQSATMPCVQTVAEMTDTTRVYLYVGNETGYNKGHMYYYNGSAWTDAGIASTDATLSITGMAADAKAAGDAVEGVSDSLTAFKNELSVLNEFSVTWGQGNIIESTGASGGSGGALYSKRLRTVLTEVPEGGFVASLPDNIQMQLYWYNSNSTSSYIGCDTLGDISNLDSPRGAWVRFVLAYTDATLAITPRDADVADVHLYTAAYTDESLTLSGKAADAKATGDAIKAAVPAVITVDVNGGADYTSLTKAIYENVDTGETIMVKPGTYDIVQEYVDLFGQDVVDSLADSTDLGGFQYGIRVHNRKMIFQPGSHVVCDWTGHTVNGTHRFSAFSVAYNAEIEGLDLDCTATFYAVHDDYGTYQVYYKNIYRNCRLIGHSLVNQNVIGGGCKPYSRTIIDNCYVDNNATGICVRYHNTNLSQAAEPVVWVSNSYFAQTLSFRWYGTQTTKMTAYVNNCYAASITKGAEGSSTNDNVDLITWNNETA